MLIQKKDLLVNKRIIELGSGCGVPGLAAVAYCNPLSVHLTDIHQPAIDNCNFKICNVITDLNDSYQALVRKKSAA